MRPIRTMTIELDIKYGKTHNPIPDKSAMPRRCLRPYTRYPMPIEPNNIPHIRDAVLPIDSCLSGR